MEVLSREHCDVVGQAGRLLEVDDPERQTRRGEKKAKGRTGEAAGDDGTLETATWGGRCDSTHSLVLPPVRTVRGPFRTQEERTGGHAAWRPLEGDN